MILPVTEVDVLAAYAAYYARPEELAHIPMISAEEIGRRDPGITLILDALRRVLENDRKHVAETIDDAIKSGAYL